MQGPLYHDSGIKLHEAGDLLSIDHLRLLKSLGIREVFQPHDSAAEVFFLEEAQYRRLPLHSLTPGQSHETAICNIKGEVLLKPGVTISESMLNTLKNRSVNTVYIRKGDHENGSRQALEYLSQKKNLNDKMQNPLGAVSNVGLDPAQVECVTNPEKDMSLAYLQKISATPMTPILPGEAFSLQRLIPPLAGRPAKDKDELLKFYLDWQSGIRRCLDELAQKKPLKEREVGRIAEQIMAGFQKDGEFLVNLCFQYKSQDYLSAHSVNTAIISASIASRMGLDPRQIYEVVYSALMADVGMVRVPNRILDKPASLTTFERLEVEKHPIYSLDLLKRLSFVPVTVPLAIYQSHEREDGSGYPKNKNDKWIHPYAKIITVADTLEAMCSPRPYREAHTPYTAMEHLLKEASGKKMSALVIRSLLEEVSLFPVGSMVELSDGRIAKVLRSNPQQMTKPIVLAVGANQAEILDLSKKTQISVKNALIGDNYRNDFMLGF